METLLQGNPFYIALDRRDSVIGQPLVSGTVVRYLVARIVLVEDKLTLESGVHCMGTWDFVSLPIPEAFLRDNSSQTLQVPILGRVTKIETCYCAGWS